jgi:hypothetical protein
MDPTFWSTGVGGIVLNIAASMAIASAKGTVDWVFPKDKRALRRLCRELGDTTAVGSAAFEAFISDHKSIELLSSPIEDHLTQASQRLQYFSGPDTTHEQANDALAQLLIKLAIRLPHISTTIHQRSIENSIRKMNRQHAALLEQLTKKLKLDVDDISQRPNWSIRPDPTSVERTISANTILDALADNTVVVISGQGGAGKTEMARHISWAAPIDDLFPGGTLWIYAGPKARYEQLLTQLVPQCQDTGEDARYLTESQVAQRFASRGASLLVVDDCSDFELIDRLGDLLGPAHAVLITSRANCPDTFVSISVDKLSTAEAVCILLGSTDCDPDLYVSASRLCAQLHHNALLVKSLARQLKRSEPRASTQTKLYQLNLVSSTIDNTFSQAFSVAKALKFIFDRGLQFLDSDSQRHFFSLAAITEPGPVPFDLLMALWSANEWATEEIAIALSDAGLVAYLPSENARQIEVHDLTALYLRESTERAELDLPHLRRECSRALLTNQDTSSLSHEICLRMIAQLGDASTNEWISLRQLAKYVRSGGSVARHCDLLRQAALDRWAAGSYADSFVLLACRSIVQSAMYYLPADIRVSEQSLELASGSTSSMAGRHRDDWLLAIAKRIRWHGAGSPIDAAVASAVLGSNESSSYEVDLVRSEALLWTHYRAEMSPEVTGFQSIRQPFLRWETMARVASDLALIGDRYCDELLSEVPTYPHLLRGGLHGARASAWLLLARVRLGKSTASAEFGELLQYLNGCPASARFRLYASMCPIIELAIPGTVTELLANLPGDADPMHDALRVAVVKLLVESNVSDASVAEEVLAVANRIKDPRLRSEALAYAVSLYAPAPGITGTRLVRDASHPFDSLVLASILSLRLASEDPTAAAEIRELSLEATFSDFLNLSSYHLESLAVEIVRSLGTNAAAHHALELVRSSRRLRENWPLNFLVERLRVCRDEGTAIKLLGEALGASLRPDFGLLVAAEYSLGASCPDIVEILDSAPEELIGASSIWAFPASLHRFALVSDVFREVLCEHLAEVIDHELTRLGAGMFDGEVVRSRSEAFSLDDADYVSLLRGPGLLFVALSLAIELDCDSAVTFDISPIDLLNYILREPLFSDGFRVTLLASIASGVYGLGEGVASEVLDALFDLLGSGPRHADVEIYVEVCGQLATHFGDRCLEEIGRWTWLDEDTRSSCLLSLTVNEWRVFRDSSIASLIDPYVVRSSIGYSATLLRASIAPHCSEWDEILDVLQTDLSGPDFGIDVLTRLVAESRLSSYAGLSQVVSDGALAGWRALSF